MTAPIATSATPDLGVNQEGSRREGFLAWRKAKRRQQAVARARQHTQDLLQEFRRLRESQS